MVRLSEAKRHSLPPYTTGVTGTAPAGVPGSPTTKRESPEVPPLLGSRKRKQTCWLSLLIAKSLQVPISLLPTGRRYIGASTPDTGSYANNEEWRGENTISWCRT